MISGVMVVGVALHFTVFSNEAHPRCCSTDRGWLEHEQGEPQDSPLLLLIKPERPPLLLGGEHVKMRKGGKPALQKAEGKTESVEKRHASAW